MSKQTRDVANRVLESVSRINPYTSREGRAGSLWAAGFLAGYLAKILIQDPILFKRFQRDVQRLIDQKRSKK